MATRLRREDPALMDDLIGFGAEATRWSSPGKQRRYAFAMGISKSTASRHMNGDEHSPATNYLEMLVNAGLDGFAVLTQGAAVVIQIQIKKATKEQLLAWLAELDDEEHSLEMEENRQTCRTAADPTPEQMEAAASANLREAMVSIRRAAILRQLAKLARAR